MRWACSGQLKCVQRPSLEGSREHCSFRQFTRGCDVGGGGASARPQGSTRCTGVLQAPGWGTQQMELCGAWPGMTCHVWGGHSRLCFAYERLVFFGTALNVFVPHCQESLKGRRALITPPQQLGCPFWAFGGPLGGPPEPGRGPKGRGAWAGTQVAVSHRLLSVRSSHGLQVWLGDVLGPRRASLGSRVRHAEQV